MDAIPRAPDEEDARDRWPRGVRRLLMVAQQSTQVTRSDVIVHSHSLPGFHGEAWHIEIAKSHYIVSAVTLPPLMAGYKAMETAVFPGRPDGSAANYDDIVMLDDVFDHEAAITALLEVVNEPPVQSLEERVEEALSMLGRFDTPSDTGRVRALIGDLRNILGGA